MHDALLGWANAPRCGLWEGRRPRNLNTTFPGGPWRVPGPPSPSELAPACSPKPTARPAPSRSRPSHQHPERDEEAAVISASILSCCLCNEGEVRISGPRWWLRMRRRCQGRCGHSVPFRTSPRACHAPMGSWRSRRPSQARQSPQPSFLRC